MSTKLIHTAFRNVTRNMRRSLLSATAIAVAAMSIVFLFSYIEGIKNDMKYNLENFYTGAIQIQHKDYEKFKRYNPLHLMVDYHSIAPILDDIEGITAYVPRTSFPANIYINEENHAAMGVGVDFAKEAKYFDLKTILTDGRFPKEGANEVLMGSGLAHELKLKIGEKITILSTTAARGTNAITLKIVGLAAFPVAGMNASFFWAPLDRVQYFLRMQDKVQNILVKTRDGVKNSKLSAEIAETLKEKSSVTYDVRSTEDTNLMYSYLELGQTIYYFIGIFFFLLGSTVIVNTTMMVIFERMREIGTLEALGMYGKELVRLFFFEGVFISTIGSFAGVLLGAAITWYFSKVGMDFTEALSGMNIEMASVMRPQLNVALTIFVFFYSVGIASLATLIPSRKAAKIEPIEALRYI